MPFSPLCLFSLFFSHRSEDSEVDFIAKIVDIVNYKLDMKLATPANLIGMDSRARFINSLLENEQSGDNALAICGMGGIGKTLAQFIYNSNKQKF